MLDWNWIGKQIRLSTISDLYTERQRHHSFSKVCNFRQYLFTAGMYSRKGPSFTDVNEIDPDCRDLVGVYYGHRLQMYGPVHHIEFYNAQLVGQGAIVTADDRLITESVIEFIAHGLAPDGLRFASATKYITNTTVTKVVDVPSIVLKRPWYSNYGHWLIDNASILSLLNRTNLPKNIQIIIGKNWSGKMKDIVYETINKMTPNIAVSEHPDTENWNIRKLHYISPLHVPPLFKHPEAINGIRLAFLGTSAQRTYKVRGIYVKRQKNSRRKLVNEMEIIQICLENEIDIISPETMDLQEQANIFQACKFVIGVKGAALTNAVFCKPGTHILALSPSDFPDPFFMDLVSQVGCYYSEIFGSTVSRVESRGQNPFRINPEKFQRALSACGMLRNGLIKYRAASNSQTGRVDAGGALEWHARAAAE